MLAVSVYLVVKVHSGVQPRAPEPRAVKTERPEVVKKTYRPPPAPPAATRPAVPMPEPESPGVLSPLDEALAAQAVESFREGSYETAIALFSELAKKDSQAHVGLGLSYYKLGDYASAAYFLEKSLGSGVNEFQVRKFLAFTYYRLDNLDGSIENAQAALGIRKDTDLQGLVEKLRRERAAQRNYIEKATPHFKVVFDGYEHSDMSGEVIEILESAYSDIGASMGHFPTETITVILYTTKDFYNVTQMPDWSGGVYDGKIRLPVKGLFNYGYDTLRRVLYHEYAHAMVLSLTTRCPQWINEGLAMHLSGEERETVGQEMPLGSLETSFPRGQAESSTAYDVSYSAVNHLVENYGLYSFRQFLQALADGNTVEEAFTSAFYMSYNEFIAQWGKT